MRLRVLVAALTAVSLSVPLVAQVPAGLKMRVDRSTNAEDPDDRPDLTVVTMGKGFRVSGGPAAVLWNPAHTAMGNYTVKANFNLQKPSNHVNYYGIVFGGTDLDKPTQAYTYFIVAQNGTYQVISRNGEQTTRVMGRTPHAAIQQPAADGMSKNVLEVRVAGDTISYVVNGQAVHSMPKGTTKTDGLVGVRVNHMLDVQVEGFEITKA